MSPRLAGERSVFVLLPALGSERDVLHPVAAMYATWLALSSLARYRPDAWREALELDDAATAAAIEEAIDLTARHAEVSLDGQLDGPVFEPLCDRELLARVAVDRESGTVTWPTGADLDPIVVYEGCRP